MSGRVVTTVEDWESKSNRLSKPTGRTGKNVESRVEVPEEGLQVVGGSAVRAEEPVAEVDLADQVEQQNLGLEDPRSREVTLGCKTYAVPEQLDDCYNDEYIPLPRIS